MAYRKERTADRKFELMARKLLVGWFMECLACKATFIRTTPTNWAIGQKGGISRRDLITGKRKVMGTVNCPDCLSQDVRLAEIGDGKQTGRF